MMRNAPLRLFTANSSLGQLRIFDSHVHVGRWGQQTIYGKLIDPFKGREIDSFEKAKAFLRNHHVRRVVLVPVYSPDPSAAFKINPAIVQCAQQSKETIIPGFWVDPSPGVQHLLNDAIKLAAEKKIRVLKTSPDAWADPYSPDPSTWDHPFTIGVNMILGFLRDNRGIFQIHTGSGKSNIQIIEKFIRYAGSEITFHLVHMGRTAGGHFYLLPRIVEWLSEGIDVVCDTSGAWGFALRWVIQEANKSPELAERILFASDEPWGIFESEIGKILHAAENDPKTVQKFLWENANRVYPVWGGIF